MKSLVIRLSMLLVIIAITASIPALACDTGKITGGIVLPSNGSKATGGFVAMNNGIDPPKGNLVYIDHDTGLKIKSTSINFVGLDFAINEGYFTGLATVTANGVKKTDVPFEVDVYDNGEAGRPDTFTIYLPQPTPPESPIDSNTLQLGGNIQLHN